MPWTVRFDKLYRAFRSMVQSTLPGAVWLDRTVFLVTAILIVLELGEIKLAASLGSHIEGLGGAALLMTSVRWLMEWWAGSNPREFVRRRGWIGVVILLWGLAWCCTPASLNQTHDRAALSLPTFIAMLVLSIGRGVQASRARAAAGAHPATSVAISFVLLILAGAGLLMLPVCRQHPPNVAGAGAPPLVAVFTATSAACVTGLVVVDTETYWSRAGQVVILILIQLGGLGIMTFGALFAVFAPSAMAMREHAFLGNLLEARHLSEVRKLLWSILTMTFLWEIGGAALLWNLWPDLPADERAFQCLFHSISAFCNAGFALRTTNLMGWGERWQVFTVIAGLIIAGGLGFATLGNLTSRIGGLLTALTGRRTTSGDWTRRLTLSSRLALFSTVALLGIGTVLVWWLESGGQLHGRTASGRWLESWFQSVSFRTAGFNAIDQAAMHPGTKFCGIVLMFIGGSPGGTAGGVKTLPAALLILVIATMLRGRERVEISHRTIADDQIKRAGTVMVLGLAVVAAATLLLVVIENKPQLFLDHFFEATSAFGTVGLSTVDTMTLAPASHAVLTITMFLGRVGPLTLLVALASRRASPAYDYPVERVMLG